MTLLSVVYIFLAFLSGEDHGECVCGKCKCNEGYKNSDCGCATTNTSCIAASSGVCFLLFPFLFLVYAIC